MTQIRKGLGLVVIGPEQGAEGIARVPATFNGKISQQGYSFTALGGDKRIIQINLWGTKKVQGEPRGHISPFASAYFFDYISEIPHSAPSDAFRHAVRHENDTPHA